MSVHLPEVSISLNDLARQPEFALVDLMRAVHSLESAVQEALQAQSQVRFHNLEHADQLLRISIEGLRKVSTLANQAAHEAHQQVTSSTEKRMRREAFEAFIEGGAL